MNTYSKIIQFKKNVFTEHNLYDALGRYVYNSLKFNLSTNIGVTRAIIQ